MDPLKTGSAARRTVPLSDDTVQLLAAHLAAHPVGRDEPVFRTRTGLMWHSGTVSAAMRALSGGAVRFHGLRHFYASALIRQGLGVNTVATLLGHASAETTLTTYVHLFPDEDERTRAAIGDALGAAAGPVRDGAVGSAAGGSGPPAAPADYRHGL